jgi:hypothetical protein
VYLSVRRNFLSPMMLAFDAPIPVSTTGRRNVSNVPAQALILLNDPFVLQQAQAWAARMLAEPAGDSTDRIERLYQTAFSRPPTAAERADAVEFLRQQAQAYGLSSDGAMTDPRPWSDLCHVLWNVKEFSFIR